MAKAIMIQGSMSSCGKSFLTAALCRIFREDGFSCAPFKSQNMALNSYITKDGLEMGRAQAVQAQAAMTEPDARMNPILLKPTADSSSQVILNGKVRGDMSAREYFSRKKELIPEIMKAYRSLSEEHDIIVIEGAGSPVELNLKKDDIVNMGLAALVKAPVLLAGDIDRGGIFAQLLGTVMLLEPRERGMVKGFIVNKFRGDMRLFEDGCAILRERSGIPAVGVVPFADCDTDDEDSLSDRLEDRERSVINIAAVRLPRISNFTDLSPLERYGGVSVFYAKKARELENADMVIIPGTKNTVSDMKWLRESGMEAAVKRRAGAGTPVFGICGGYQMLCESISDPLGCEGGGEIRGMGLLRGNTVFGGEKLCANVKGKINGIGGIFAGLSGKEFSGYEIHMGRTSGNASPLAVLDGGAYDGGYSGNVYGSYVHGIFDNDVISGEIVRSLYAAKGIAQNGDIGGGISYDAYREAQYAKMAKTVRDSLDMKLVYRILEEGI
ncbi:MAG: cobyric acid synthase [Ruminococcus sp.]|nr:cobyric acid synthase [Ruminococcus sp.]